MHSHLTLQKWTYQTLLHEKGGLPKSTRGFTICPLAVLQNFNKSREVLNTTEEKLKSVTVDLQKTSMDLVAKRSECQARFINWTALKL